MAFVKIIGKVATAPAVKTVVMKDNTAKDVLYFSVIFGSYVKNGKTEQPRVPCSMWKESVFHAREFKMGDIVEVVGTPKNEIDTGQVGLGWQPTVNCFSVRRIGNPMELGTTATLADSYFDVSGPIKFIKETEIGTFVTLEGPQKPRTEHRERYKLVWWRSDGVEPPEGMEEGKWLNATGLYNITSYDSKDKEGNPCKRVEAQCKVRHAWLLGTARFDYTNEDDDIPF